MTLGAKKSNLKKYNKPLFSEEQILSHAMVRHQHIKCFKYFKSVGLLCFK